MSCSIDLRNAVRNGALLLDEKEPLWFLRINLETLRLTGCYDCIFGQLFGAYTPGVVQRELGVDASDFGFTVPWSIDDAEEMDLAFFDLQRFWMIEIFNRRLAAAQPPERPPDEI